MAKKKKTKTVKKIVKEVIEKEIPKKEVIKEVVEITPTPVPVPVPVPVKRVEFPLSFAEYIEDVDNYLSRALKSYANINDILITKTRSEWDYLLLQMKSAPIK